MSRPIPPAPLPFVSRAWAFLSPDRVYPGIHRGPCLFPSPNTVHSICLPVSLVSSD